jgi:hypothetical protein
VVKKVCIKKSDSWKRNHGKESVQKECDNWEEAQHTHMQEGGDRWKEAMNACGEGRPNDKKLGFFIRVFL